MFPTRCVNALPVAVLSLPREYVIAARSRSTCDSRRFADSRPRPGSVGARERAALALLPAVATRALETAPWPHLELILSAHARACVRYFSVQAVRLAAARGCHKESNWCVGSDREGGRLRLDIASGSAVSGQRPADRAIADHGLSPGSRGQEAEGPAKGSRAEAQGQSATAREGPSRQMRPSDADRLGLGPSMA